MPKKPRVGLIRGTPGKETSKTSGFSPAFPFSAPTAPPVHFPTTLHRSITKTISDQRVKPCWKNRPTLKLRREFAASERKRRNVPLEHPQGRQKKLCFQGGLGGGRGRGAGSARWRLEQEREPKGRNSLEGGCLNDLHHRQGPGRQFFRLANSAWLSTASALCPARQFLGPQRQTPMDGIQLQALAQYRQAGLIIILAR